MKHYKHSKNEKNGWTSLFQDLVSQDKEQAFMNGVFEWMDIVVTSAIAVVIIFTFFFRIVSIDGSSMENTLFEKERVVITNMFYNPKYGDIVVISRNTYNDIDFANQNEPIIKRVIATEGQTVDIDFDAGIVYIEGNALEENYVKELTHMKQEVNFPVTVPEHCIFVMGDNRNKSRDSRSTWVGENGMINVKYVLGHAIYRVYPFDKIGSLMF